MPVPTYPLVPKSTRLLKRGQFWVLPLDGGRYGAGCVVGEHVKEGVRSSRLFIAGVVHWVGDHPPTAADILGRPVVDFAFAHLKSITESDGEILGEAEIEFSGAPTTASAMSLSTWGYGFPRLVAQRVAIDAG